MSLDHLLRAFLFLLSFSSETKEVDPEIEMDQASLTTSKKSFWEVQSGMNRKGIGTKFGYFFSSRRIGSPFDPPKDKILGEGFIPNKRNES